MELDTTCSPNQFQCNNGQCIPSYWKCDSKADCDDKSDEPKECIKMQSCNEGQFQCKVTRKCIPNEWICDGDFDCDARDKSDEDPTKCHTAKMCLPNQSECEGGLCIDTEKFCDGKIDCINDENFKVCHDPNASVKCTELKCSYNCKITPTGPKCYCPIGQEPNGTQCQDFNECKIESTCDQICKNTPNSFECSCVSGYTKKSNRCFGINEPPNELPSLFFLTQTDIQRTSITGDPWNSTSTYKINNPITLEMWHRNRTVCVINGSSAVETVDFRCHNADDLSISWKMPQPDMFLALT
ncbi:Prolow-density lipoprotein receptor-related protein 1, partial [Pseudolycoriella hygida]